MVWALGMEERSNLRSGTNKKHVVVYLRWRWSARQMMQRHRAWNLGRLSRGVLERHVHRRHSSE